ncbi:hypothetical protein HYX13_02265 [Candidatus Woesearchaeota archaeon]|nr:hypothetical protein [Candidatus Woesearchaeota archaeon]
MKTKYMFFLLSVLVASLFLFSCVPPAGEDDLPPEPKAPGAGGALAGQAYTDDLSLAGM